MSVLPVATMEYQAGKHRLSVTARNLGEPSEIITQLIVRSIKLWIYLAILIEKGERTTPHDKSVEMLVQEETNTLTENGMVGFSFEPWNETRVTIWDFSKHVELTLHSDSMPQALLNIWWAMHDAKVELGTAQHTPPEAPQASQTGATPAQATTPQKHVNVTGKKAAKELPAHSSFVMPIAKVAAVMSRDGKLTWELYARYGKKPGQYSDLLVYSDNPKAIENGLIGKLQALNLQPGNAMEGTWSATGFVGEKDGKKSLYVVDIAASA